LSFEADFGFTVSGEALASDPVAEAGSLGEVDDVSCFHNVD